MLLWATALYAGLRRGELPALRWQDVDFERGLVCVERGWDRVVGPIEPKSRAGRRRFPLAGGLRKQLLAHRLLQGRGGRGLAFGASAERALDASTVVDRARGAWRRARREPITLHACRHTYAAFVIAAGVNAPARRTRLAYLRSTPSSYLTRLSSSRRRVKRVAVAAVAAHEPTAVLIALVDQREDVLLDR